MDKNFEKLRTAYHLTKNAGWVRPFRIEPHPLGGVPNGVILLENDGAGIALGLRPDILFLKECLEYCLDMLDQHE